MFARVSEFTGTAQELAESIRDAAEISAQVDAMPGSLGMYYLVDGGQGKALAITLWETEAAMTASERAAGQIRQTSSRAQGTSIVGVGHYEVAANTAKVPAATGGG